MKPLRKPFKFYLSMFIILSIAVIGYTIYKIYKDQTPIVDLASLWVMPLFFTLIYFFSDIVLDKIFNRKKKLIGEDKFIHEIDQRIRDKNLFLVEEYRRLQINQKFQESLKIAFKIYENGENEYFSKEKLLRKFKKDSAEFKAIECVIQYLEESKKL
ncbi:MAG: hypothetical protein WCY80_05920 [Candidatus Izemoplasmatales bacterium]